MILIIIDLLEIYNKIIIHIVITCHKINKIIAYLSQYKYHIDILDTLYKEKKNIYYYFYIRI